MSPAPTIRFGYCERGDSAFWAEPLNAVTNGAFLMAAGLALLLWLGSARRDGPSALLIVLVAAIGVGSFLFHTMPMRWTLLADVVPIQFFAFSYFGLALRRYLDVPLWLAVIGTLGFVGFALGLSGLLAPLLPFARGSAGYAAFVLALFGVAALVARREGASPTAVLLAAAGAIFALSLTLRSLDGVACATVPFGLHWLWHVLNAVVLYLLLRAAILRPVRG